MSRKQYWKTPPPQVKVVVEGERHRKIHYGNDQVKTVDITRPLGPQLKRMTKKNATEIRNKLYRKLEMEKFNEIGLEGGYLSDLLRLIFDKVIDLELGIAREKDL